MTIVAVLVGRSDASLSLHQNYIDAVLAAGGTPLMVPTSFTEDDGRLERALGAADVLLLAGGGDIQPAIYGAEPATTLDQVDPLRDEVEMRALAWARNAQRRVLGICRGAQMLAVASGGTLVQDLPSAGFGPHVDVRHDRTYAGLRHVVKADPGSLAERVLGGLAEVNSQHHQAVCDVGAPLVVTAWSADGVVEALEGPNVLGVQWHPEVVWSQDRRHLRPFQWLVSGEAEWEQ